MGLHIGKAKADEDPRAVRGMLEAWGSGGGGAGMGAGRGGFEGGDGFPEGLGVGTDPSSLREGGVAGDCGEARCKVRRGWLT